MYPTNGSKVESIPKITTKTLRDSMSILSKNLTPNIKIDDESEKKNFLFTILKNESLKSRDLTQIILESNAKRDELSREYDFLTLYRNISQN